MNTHFPISLTPNFSWVLRAARMREPFQRFLARVRETVETVSPNLAVTHTWLKPGVNEISLPTVSRPANPALSFVGRLDPILPLPGGEGRGEGERFTNPF